MSPSSTATMPLLDHFIALRKRLFVSLIGFAIASAIAFGFYAVIVKSLMLPFTAVMPNALNERLFVTSLFEGFFARMKLAMIGGFVLSFPLHLYGFVRFVFPGLKKRERKWIGIGLVTSFLLAAFSFYMSYFKIVPLTIALMTTSGFIPQDVGLLLNFKENIFYIVHLVFYALLLFQLPILLEILLALNILSRKTLLSSSRFVILGIFVLCAIVTPPDIISQVSLALPLIGLFFVTILIAKLFGWGGVTDV